MDVAELADALASVRGVRLFVGRRLPGPGLPVVDLVAVTAGGVVVIHLADPTGVGHRRTGADRVALFERVGHQVAAVSAVMGPEVPVAGLVVAADGERWRGARSLYGVRRCSERGLVRRLRQLAAATDATAASCAVDAMASVIDRRLAPN